MAQLEAEKEAMEMAEEVTSENKESSNLVPKLNFESPTRTA